jgi:multiple sugar transport system substrate-binding protein
MRKHQMFLGIILAGAAVALAGCSGSDQSSDKDGKTLTVWTVEDDATRVAAQQKIFKEYTEKTGVAVKLVALPEDNLATVLASSAAANQLPDVVGAVSLSGLNQMDSDDLLDSQAATDVVQELGKDTFDQRALELTKSGDSQLGVPSDGWAQLLFYRSDLFKKAGLEPPTTYEALEKAAATLKTANRAGVVASTAPADSFTQQTFEHFALANGCQLVDDGGKIALDSPACQETLQFYADLIKKDSVSGNQDADTTRATYFAGKAAMVVWSSFLLDELAGLRKDAVPTCPECAADPAFLARNTGVVSTIKGPHGTEPASFGEIVSWGVLKDASPAAKDFVKYMMSDSYEKWLAIAPEGKVPTRAGTADDKAAFSQAWQKMQAGVDKKAVLSSVYGQAVLSDVVEAPQHFSRWGIPQGQGKLAGTIAAQYVVPQAIAEMINSGKTAQQASTQAKQRAETIKSDLG